MNPTLSRRTFLLTGGALGGAVAAEAAGLGFTPVHAQDRRPIKQGKEVPIVCPYCAVGCGQIATVADGKLIDIQGNYESPINEGTLCPKGAATFQLAVNPHRWTKAKYRAPNSDHWEEIELETAMDMIAERYQKTRDETFTPTRNVDGQPKKVNHTLGIFSLGGATLDDEWNYAHQKLLRATGVVAIENQARI